MSWLGWPSCRTARTARGGLARARLVEVGSPSPDWGQSWPHSREMISRTPRGCRARLSCPAWSGSRWCGGERSQWLGLSPCPGSGTYYGTLTSCAGESSQCYHSSRDQPGCFSPSLLSSWLSPPLPGAREGPGPPPSLQPPGHSQAPRWTPANTNSQTGEEVRNNKADLRMYEWKPLLVSLVVEVRRGDLGHSCCSTGPATAIHWQLDSFTVLLSVVNRGNL